MADNRRIGQNNLPPIVNNPQGGNAAPTGPLANQGVQPNRNPQWRNGINYGQQPPLANQPNPPNVNLNALQPQHPGPVVQQPQAPVTQVGGFHLANAPALANVVQVPVPTAPTPGPVGGAMDNLKAVEKLFTFGADVVGLTHTKGSERFAPVEELLSVDTKTVSFANLPLAKLQMAAQAYVDERGEKTTGVFNKQTVQVQRPQPQTVDALMHELRTGGHESTVNKLMVADFVLREVGSFQTSSAAVTNTIMQANSQQPLALTMVKDLVRIAIDHPTQAAKNAAKAELTQAIGQLTPQQARQLVQQMGPALIDQAMYALDSQAATVPGRAQALTRIADAVASLPQLAASYVQHGKSETVIDTIINGRDGNGQHRLADQDFRRMVAAQFKFELPQQRDQDLLRGNTPVSRMFASGVERTGQGYLHGLGQQIATAVQQAVQTARGQGTAMTVVDASGRTVANPALVGNVMQQILPSFDPQAVPAGLNGFLKFVAANIEQAPNLHSDGEQFCKNAAVLRNVNADAIAIVTGTHDQDAQRLAVAVTQVLQRAVSENGAPFPQHSPYAGLNNWVTQITGANHNFSQWLDGLVH